MKPWKKIKGLEGNVVFALSFYANTFYVNVDAPGKTEAIECFRQRSCDISAFQYTKPPFLFIERWNPGEISSDLIGLSNWSPPSGDLPYSQKNIDALGYRPMENTIRKLLKIKKS